MTTHENSESDLLQMITDPRLEPSACRVIAGQRLDLADGLLLMTTPDLLTVGRLATLSRRRRNGSTTWYIVNHHINYSNVCVNRCRFCAFSRRAGAEGSYAMSLAEIMAEARQAQAAGATELHIVGGLHPELPLDYYLEMLGRLREMLPAVHLQAFTAVEVAHLAALAGRSTRETLSELQRAGLGSLPGGGAEIFATRVREALCPEKLPSRDWLRVMQEAHELGLPSNATMLYGHIETAAERVEHLLALRELQDRTGGFMTFIPLAFHPQNTELAGTVPDRAGGAASDPATAASGGATSCAPAAALGLGTCCYDDLRVLAVGRLMLDNFPHVKAFWIMLGLELAQMSQHFGADDLDGTVVREKITHAAGARTPQSLTVEEIRSLITEAGFEPRERNTVYRRVVRQGADWSLQ